MQPLPLTILGRGRWKGRSSLFLFTSDMAVWRLSRELDFFKPRVGPSSTGADGDAGHGETRRPGSWKCSNNKTKPLEGCKSSRYNSPLTSMNVLLLLKTLLQKKYRPLVQCEDTRSTSFIMGRKDSEKEEEQVVLHQRNTHFDSCS